MIILVYLLAAYGLISIIGNWYDWHHGYKRRAARRLISATDRMIAAEKQERVYHLQGMGDKTAAPPQEGIRTDAVPGD